VSWMAPHRRRVVRQLHYSSFSETSDAGVGWRANLVSSSDKVNVTKGSVGRVQATRRAPPIAAMRSSDTGSLRSTILKSLCTRCTLQVYPGWVWTIHVRHSYRPRGGRAVQVRQPRGCAGVMDQTWRSGRTGDVSALKCSYRLTETDLHAIDQV